MLLLLAWIGKTPINKKFSHDERSQNFSKGAVVASREFMSGFQLTDINRGAKFYPSFPLNLYANQNTEAGTSQSQSRPNYGEKAHLADQTPPVILSATAISANMVNVLFNEEIDIASSQLPANYVGNNSLGSAANAILDAANPALVHITFAGNFIPGFNYGLTVNGVKDLVGNAIQNGQANFMYVISNIANHYDVVIDEIMTDPLPQVGLPNNEWIELKNTSANPINLKGWKVGDATGQSGPMPDFILMPDSFVIICPGSAVAAMSPFGATISVTGFPSLDNTTDLLFLISFQNKMIHSVHYSDSWYQNPLKKEGGWTLEMIDTKSPCNGFSNWRASTDPKGGSPGKKNKIDAVNKDQDGPRLLRAYPTDSVTILLVFDEPVDSMLAASAFNFNISDGIGIPLLATAVAPTFDRVNLKLNKSLSRNRIYDVTVSGVSDCVGNRIDNKNIVKVGLPEPATKSDIIINEILFNPVPTGVDYLEIYNPGKKIIDLGQTYIANRNITGSISNIARLTAESYLLFPGNFIVLTESILSVKTTYLTQNRDAFLEISSMPSFNDDKGTALLLNAQGEVMDELAYNEKWHFKLMDRYEGVSLERIDYNTPTQMPDNWHSAATSVGYGTPTYKNSQYRADLGLQGEIKISPEIVSPDNDGQDDFATVEYGFPEPGYIASIVIFDASGRPVRYLQKNALCGTKGNFRWDGLGEKGQRLATGVYVAFTEVFNLKGNKRRFKNAIVLARRN